MKKKTVVTKPPTSSVEIGTQDSGAKTSENKKPTTEVAIASLAKGEVDVLATPASDLPTKPAPESESKESNVDDIMLELNALFSGDYVNDDTNVDDSEFAEIFDEVDNTMFS